MKALGILLIIVAAIVLCAAWIYVVSCILTLVSVVLFHGPVFGFGLTACCMILLGIVGGAFRTASGK